MALKKAKIAAKKIVPVFESNPFKVVFNNFTNMFKYNSATMIFFIVGAFLFYIIYTIFSVVVSLTGEEYGSSPQTQTYGNTETEPAIVIIVIGVIFLLVFWLVILFVWGMANHAAYTTQLKKKTTLGESFNATLEKFGSIVLVGTIYVVVQAFYISAAVLGTIALGTLTSFWISPIVAVFFTILAVRFALRYTYAFYPLFANNMSAMQSYKHLKKITKGHLIEILTQGLIVNIVGQFTLTAISIPAYASNISFMYPQMEAASNANQKTKIHWANWLILGIYGFFIALIIGLFVVIGILAAREEVKSRNDGTQSIFDDSYYNSDTEYDSYFDKNYDY